MVNRVESPSIFTFERTSAQLAALESIAQAWHLGPEQFWDFDSVLSALSRPGCVLFFSADTKEDEQWSGVILLDVGPFSADLLYVYVRPEAREKRIGRFLMEHVFYELAGKKNIEALFLEVRVSNKAAQRLYQSLNMELIGTRKKYYANGEDALIYKANFECQESEPTRG